MKINGRKLSGPNEEVIILPRGGDVEDIIFRARAILSYKPFEDLVARPTPPSKMMKGGAKVPDTNNKNFQAAVLQYNRRRMAWSLITSLQATPGIEWETVDYNDPNTWENWENELRDGGLSESEIAMVINGYAAANSLSEEKLEAARERFLRLSQEQQEKSSYQKDGDMITQFGELANDLDYVRQE